ncbi:hypothetical protein RSAG8_10609, partial [Rhizoctonia solani AG-8 WAC10335]
MWTTGTTKASVLSRYIACVQRKASSILASSPQPHYPSDST